MRTFTFLFLALIIACASPKKHQTVDYDKLYRGHKKLAILPVNFEDKRYKPGLSEIEKNELLQKENDFVQNAFYQRILRESGNGKKDIKVSIEPVSITNNKLKKAGIDVLQISKYTDTDIAKALSVDAVLRIKINAAIMLHSTDYDLPKEILSSARIFIKDPLLSRAIDLNIEPVFLYSEIIDLKEFSPIWVYYKKRELEVHDKNTDLMNWLCNDLARRFPYRNQ